MGDWKTICIWRYASRSALPFAFVTSIPFSRMVPADGSISRVISFASVLFPQPDSPDKAQRFALADLKADGIDSRVLPAFKDFCQALCLQDLFHPVMPSEAAAQP